MNFVCIGRYLKLPRVAVRIHFYIRFYSRIFCIMDVQNNINNKLINEDLFQDQKTTELKEFERKPIRRFHPTCSSYTKKKVG